MGGESEEAQDYASSSVMREFKKSVSVLSTLTLGKFLKFAGLQISAETGMTQTWGCGVKI